MSSTLVLLAGDIINTMYISNTTWKHDELEGRVRDYWDTDLVQYMRRVFLQCEADRVGDEHGEGRGRGRGGGGAGRWAVSRFRSIYLKEVDMMSVEHYGMPLGDK